MICFDCGGRGWVAPFELCPECYGVGVIHCCDGLMEQPGEQPAIQSSQPSASPAALRSRLNNR